MDNIPSNYLNNAQVNKVIEAKYLAQWYKHGGTSGAWTRCLAAQGPTLFR